MPFYYVEGLYTWRQVSKKKHDSSASPVGSIEPYAKTIWAESPSEAIQVATDELQGGEWTKAPKVSLLTEEQRMGFAHQPEFPGFTVLNANKRKQ
jgi:hypothetical protein